MRSRGSNLPPADLNFPEKSLHDWLIAILIFGLSALHFSWFYRYTVLNADEGIVLQGAQRILQGQVLYRDFFSLLTPGSYYWNAFFFKVFGSSVLVGRGVLLVEGALLSVLTYLLSRRVCSRWAAFLASGLLTLTGVPNRFLVLHNWDSTFWAVLTVYCAVLFLRYPARVLLFGTGWFAALTFLFEQSKGAGILFGLGLALAILAANDRASLHHFKPGSLPALALGFLLPFLFTLVYFTLQHALAEMLADWFWPIRNYSRVNQTPYGFVVLLPEGPGAASEPWTSRLLTILLTGPWFIVPALPLLAVCVLIYWSQNKWRANSDESGRPYYVLVSAAVAGLLLSILAVGRPDFTHLVYISPILFVVLAWIIDGQWLPSFLRPALPLLSFVLLVSCLGFGLSLVWQPMKSAYVLHTRRGTLKAYRSDEIIEYVQKNIPAGQTVLIYPYLPLYYYLTGTFSPGRYEYLMPGFHSPEQFQQFVKELDTDQTRIVLFEDSFREKIPPDFPAAPDEIRTARDPVADYINTHYSTCRNLKSQNYWHFVAMVRNDLPCP